MSQPKSIKIGDDPTAYATQPSGVSVNTHGAQPKSNEIKDRLKYFYMQTDGTYKFPNSAEGDLLQMVHEYLAQKDAECLCKDKGVIELIEAERAEVKNKFEQVVANMPGRLFLLPPNVEKVVGYIKEDGIGDVAYKGQEIDLMTVVKETLALTPKE